METYKMDKNNLDEKNEIKKYLERIVEKCFHIKPKKLEVLKGKVREFPSCTEEISRLSSQNFDILLSVVSEIGEEKHDLELLKLNELTVIVDKNSGQDEKQDFYLNKFIEIKNLVFSFKSNIDFYLSCQHSVPEGFVLTLNKNESEEQLISFNSDKTRRTNSFDVNIKTDVNIEEHFGVKVSGGEFHGLFINEIKNIQLSGEDENQSISIKSDKNMEISVVNST